MKFIKLNSCSGNKNFGNNQSRYDFAGRIMVKGLKINFKCYGKLAGILA